MIDILIFKEKKIYQSFFFYWLKIYFFVNLYIFIYFFKMNYFEKNKSLYNFLVNI